MTRPKIKVLIVDDSAIVRTILTDLLSADPYLEVVGAAHDPYEARDMILQLRPDVLTLDIEMPKMDGITFLKLVMKHQPIPAIILSSLSKAGSAVALDALAAGAVDVMAKPGSSSFTKELGPELIAKIKGAVGAKRPAPFVPPPAASAAPAHVLSSGSSYHDPRQIILLGASTGGTEVLKEIFARLPGNLPPICIVQHIPSAFSGAFAKRLDEVARCEVREAREGDVLRPGLALLAPGDFHMVLRRTGDQGYGVSLKQGPKIHFCRPSVDVLFESAAPLAGRRAVAGILTGMGDDGAQGLLKLRQAGARTFAQDQKTSIVYGMPRVAVEVGAAETVLPLDKIADHIVKTSSSISARSA